MPAKKEVSWSWFPVSFTRKSQPFFSLSSTSSLAGCLEICCFSFLGLAGCFFPSLPYSCLVPVSQNPSYLLLFSFLKVELFSLSPFDDFFLRFFFFFNMDHFLKSLLSALQFCFCFMLWFFDCESYGVFAFPPRGGTSSPALEAEVLTPGPPGRFMFDISLNILIDNLQFEQSSPPFFV